MQLLVLNSCWVLKSSCRCVSDCKNQLTRSLQNTFRAHTDKLRNAGKVLMHDKTKMNEKCIKQKWKKKKLKHPILHLSFVRWWVGKGWDHFNKHKITLMLYCTSWWGKFSMWFGFQHSSTGSPNLQQYY